MTTTRDAEAARLDALPGFEGPQHQARTTGGKDRPSVEARRRFSALEPRSSALALGGHASPITESANLALILAALVVGLIVDQHGGVAGQLAVSVCIWGVFFWLLRSSPREWRLPLYACLVWATAGEIFLSLVWGLYTYRLGNIPLFVPPGHALLFYFVLILAPRVPRAFVTLVSAAAVGYAAFAWIKGFDTISVALVVVFLLFMLHAEGRRLYALMLVASLILEVYGTWIGNWVWHRDVPYMYLNSANPPIAAGAFYCALDVLVGLTVRGIKGLPRMASAPRLTAQCR